MRPVSEHHEIAAMLGCLAFHDATIGQAEAEHVALRSVWYGIELHDQALASHLRNVRDATKIALTTVQTSDARERLGLRHIVCVDDISMQTAFQLRAASCQLKTENYAAG
jgi:uncharacterized lipoprotein NlpE involved in copper resistance